MTQLIAAEWLRINVMVQEKKTDYYETLGDKFEEYMSDYDVERRLDFAVRQ